MNGKDLYKIAKRIVDEASKELNDEDVKSISVVVANDDNYGIATVGDREAAQSAIESVLSDEGNVEVKPDKIVRA